jgi:APA family basic amino acid/polyamine antiporter
MIAVGIFVLPVLAVEEGKTVATLSFIIAALVAAFTAAACTELFSIYCKAGGRYTYIPNFPVFKRSFS